ncbi:MAG: hypothetical protein R2684_05670 [Pyrinomonadaceae bacterium]
MKRRDNTSDQPGLFDANTEFSSLDVVRFALGDFADRGFELAGRELALDRLMGALKRAYGIFDILPLDDRIVADTLRNLGAEVTEVPDYVAKHPFRFVVPEKVGKDALEFFRSHKE